MLPLSEDTFMPGEAFVTAGTRLFCCLVLLHFNSHTFSEALSSDVILLRRVKCDMIDDDDDDDGACSAAENVLCP
jgi:hypothetical protein